MIGKRTMDQPLVARILRISRMKKRALALAVDSGLCVATVLTAFYLRLGVWALPVGTQWLSVVASLLFALPIFVSSGLYRAIFRYAGWPALVAVTRAGVLYGLIYSAVFTLGGVSGVPRTIGFIQPMLLFLAVGGSRAIARFWLGGGYEALMRLGERKHVLIYGAGSAGRQLAAALANSSEMQVVGFVDDDEALQGSVLSGRTIYSGIDLPGLFERLGVEHVFLALPSASRKRRNEILELIRGTSVEVRTLPGLMDLAHGRVTVDDLRELDIEDLLGRDPIAPDANLMSRNIVGKTVMVTGAGGSIGSELCRQIVALGPNALLLVDNSEVGLYSIHQELESRIGHGSDLEVRVIPLLASVLDGVRMANILETWRPATVFHAAAYKHVPLVEYNPIDGVRNNVFGTLVAAQTAERHGVENFVLVSTDKAVRPTNIMGATKRLSEMILQSLSDNGGKTCYSMVRFGNVLGSSGSVVPLFRKQIRAGGPITITHEEITRYFMTIPEASQLVIQASAMGSGGEVFVLDMGEPVKIVDLARRMAELSGLSVKDDRHPNGDIEIEIVGLRPGEKLFEELLIGENSSRTSHARIMKANEPFVPWESFRVRLDALNADVEAHDVNSVILALTELVSGYAAEPKISDWVAMERAKITSSIDGQLSG